MKKQLQYKYFLLKAAVFYNYKIIKILLFLHKGHFFTMFFVSKIAAIFIIIYFVKKGGFLQLHGCKKRVRTL